ncbi:flagellar hook-associated protein FlgK [Chelativorans sp. SCAU2101]|uniref:Flagellar hook-associated protein 1 n=1 Tax=Chelativorans petroleitrophicus TaxID=2975484 RepID=A0A9X2X551_9HYPH|nr:flagellar hook-associated protein FlgK [Chelativorans petroleitrophicus]MCT8989262.1 flagellar hook-associated protein FlgK [Chelativorans petroleitrophicus]
MSLTSALSIAQSALFNTSRQTSIVSRNVSEASNPDYARRSAVLSSMAPGARIAEIRRATNAVLFRQNLAAISGAEAQSVLTERLDTLRLRVNGADNAASPAAALGALQEALQAYAATPSNRALAAAAVEAARGMVRSLNEGAAAVQSFRAEVDRDIAAAVNDLNRLLGEFETANRQVVAGTRTGQDVSDALDRRDALLKQISAIVPVSVITRADNDVILTTADGVTLFETVPRPVAFAATPVYAAGTVGNPVFIDGVPLAPGQGGNTSAMGSLAALLQLRDDAAVTMQRQLDEIARGVIMAFAEPPSGAASTGLFVWTEEDGTPHTDLPAAGGIVDGLAGRIELSSVVVSNPERLRDGISYTFNTDGSASYSELLHSFLDKLDEPFSFHAEAGLDDTASLSAFTAQSIGWLEGLRQNAAGGLEAKGALARHTAEILSNATGVNIDEEMALLLELERAYEASARIIRVVDEMLSRLMEVAGRP